MRDQSNISPASFDPGNAIRSALARRASSVRTIRIHLIVESICCYLSVSLLSDARSSSSLRRFHMVGIPPSTIALNGVLPQNLESRLGVCAHRLACTRARILRTELSIAMMVVTRSNWSRLRIRPSGFSDNCLRRWLVVPPSSNRASFWPTFHLLMILKNCRRLGLLSRFRSPNEENAGIFGAL